MIRKRRSHTTLPASMGREAEGNRQEKEEPQRMSAPRPQVR
jgi:hypothetical protein